MKTVLFIGSFLSNHDGSLSFSESLTKQLNIAGIDCKLVSTSPNKIKRLAEVIWSGLVFNGRIVHIDVFSDMAFLIAEIASKIAVLRHKKIILTLRGGKFIEFYETNSLRVNRVLETANLLQTPSLFINDYFRSKGFIIQYRPNAIDLSNFHFNRTQIKKHSLLWVRAFTKIYNPHLAIMILKKVQEQYPNATLTMIGPDKGLLSEIKQLVHDLKLDHSVIFTGPLPHDVLYRFFQTHEVYLNTTSYESFGNAVIEAASCGIPIVSSDVGEIPWLWQHEENVLLVRKMEADEFAREIIKLFENSNLADSLVRKARIKAEFFAWEEILPQWVELLTKL